MCVCVCAKRVLPNCIPLREVTGFTAPLLKCAFLDTMSLFETDVGSGDWQRIQDEIHDGTFFSSSLLPSSPCSLTRLFPSLNLLYRKFKNKMEQGRER